MPKSKKFFFFSAIIVSFFASALGGVVSAKTINLTSTSTDILYFR